MDISITVVIPTMNRIDALEETIASIKQSTYIPDEIVIMDQSTDENIQREIKALTEKAELNFTYRHLDRASLTFARNESLKYISNEIVVFMDDDVSVQEETFENIYKIMNDSNIALIGGINLNASKSDSKLGYIFGMKSAFKNKLGGYVTNSMYGRYRQKILHTMPTQWAMGFFFALRKSIIISSGIRWDEKFITYGYPEDLDFSFRYINCARKQGGAAIIDNRVSVFHRVSQEWRETKTAVTFMKIINREYLTYKLGCPAYYRLYTRWANFGVFLERLIHKDAPFDVIKAQYYCDKYRKDIKNGILHTELYSN